MWTSLRAIPTGSRDLMRTGAPGPPGDGGYCAAVNESLGAADVEVQNAPMMSRRNRSKSAADRPPERFERELGVQ